MTDRQPESVTAPPRTHTRTCSETYNASEGHSGCVCPAERWYPPAPAPEATPEWAITAATDVQGETNLIQSYIPKCARLIHAAYLASEEARKVEEPKVWLVMEAYAPTDSEDGPRLSTIHATKEGAEDDARRRNAVCDPDEGYIYSVEGPWLIHR